MAKQSRLTRKCKEKSQVDGFYSDRFDNVNFRERVKASSSRKSLPGHFIVERIISARGTAKVRMLINS